MLRYLKKNSPLRYWNFIRLSNEESAVTIASVGHSLSKLKLMKNFMPSTTTQERLTDLAVLSIESDIARSVEFNDIINNFANMKARKFF